MARGFVYLTAVLDWHSRRVLAHRASITMQAEFCAEALQEPIARYGAPRIVDTDQGSQRTGEAEPKRHRIATSMDWRGRWWCDNVFVERLEERVGRGGSRADEPGAHLGAALRGQEREGGRCARAVSQRTSSSLCAPAVLGPRRARARWSASTRRAAACRRWTIRGAAAASPRGGSK